jgi:hypothetical protein
MCVWLGLAYRLCATSIVSTWNSENAAAYQAALADLERKTANLKKPVVADAAIVDNGADISRFSGRERQPKETPAGPVNGRVQPAEGHQKWIQAARL